MRGGDENSGGVQGARRPVRARLRLVGRALLAGAFLPLALVVGQAVPAEAVESKWTGVHWALGGAVSQGSGFMDVDCWGALKLLPDSGHVKLANGECVGSTDLSPGYVQVGEADGNIEVWVTGEGCIDEQTQRGLTKHKLGDHPSNNTSTVAGTMADLEWDVGACTPTQACVWNEANGSTRQKCTPVDFGMPEPGTTCQYGTPTMAKWSATQDLSGTYQGYWRARGSGAWVGADGLTWSKKPVVLQANGNITHSWVWTEYNLTVPPGGTLNPWAGDPSFNSPSAGGAQLLGVQVTKADLTDPQFDQHAGYTRPGECSFYFGTKFRDTLSDDTDEPWGENGAAEPVEVDPVPESPLTEPDPDRPTDEPGWLGWIFNVLKSILGAILGLVGAIGGLLMDLFTPSPGSWGLDGLKGQLDAKPPFSLIGSAGEATSGFVDAFSGAGNCGVLANFDVPVGDGSISCSAVRNAPGLNALYTLVQAGLVALTGWALFRMVSGYFQDGQ